MRGPSGGAAAPRKRGGRPGGAPKRLRLEQRLAIRAGLEAGLAQREIARGLGFDRSTVSREVSRHRGRGGECDPCAAQSLAERAARPPKARKLDSDPRLRAEVKRLLSERLSPRQVSAQLRIDFPDEEGMRVGHETVYQSLYVQGRGSLRQELKLEKALRSGRKARLPQSRLGSGRGRGKGWVEGCEISKRPPEAEDRAVPGHWEGDLVVGGDLKSCLTTLVERSTRLVLVRRLDLHPTKLVTSELARRGEGVLASMLFSVLDHR